MPIMRFGEYLPDLPALDNPGSPYVNNVLPFLDGAYRPLKDVSAITSALTARCRGAYSVRNTDAAAYTYAGDATKLYEITGGATSFTDRSGATYTTAADENWEFCKFNNKIIATNLSDEIQWQTIASGTNFADLVASPKAWHIGVVAGSFIVAGNLDESGTLSPTKIRWSAFEDETDWTAAASTMSDSRTLRSSAQYGGGWVQKIIGGEYGVIFQEFSIWRMTFVGSPKVFQLDEVLPGYGTPAVNSVTQYGNMIFYLGQEGFDLVMNGVERIPIGANKVDNFFLADVDSTYMMRVIGAVDPTNRIVAWIYPAQDASSGIPNRIIAYNWITKKWGRGAIDAEWIFCGLGSGYTLDELDSVNASLDALPASLDSRQYVEGALQLSAFDEAHKLSGFTGSELAASADTPEVEIIPGRRTMLRGARPLVVGSSVTATITPITRNLQTATATTGSASSVHSETGIAPLRTDARYHRLRVTTSGSFDHLIGVDVPRECIAVTGRR